MSLSIILGVLSDSLNCSDCLAWVLVCTVKIIIIIIIIIIDFIYRG